MKSPVLSTIACNLDRHILAAALPLFAAEKVQAIEWSFDALFRVKNIPDWFVELLATYSDAQRLVGHGVFFSLFSGKWYAEQDQWLKHLKKVANNFQFDHITEHFGFMTGANFHEGAPIGIPYTSTTLAIGHDRLKRIYEACNCPVGLENLAFAYSLDEVKRHGNFLAELIEPVNGFIILDLHNLYCQLHNFDVDFSEIIQAYPLDRVREIHISGGSWEASDLSPERPIRRDTHNDSVPEEVFELLQKTLKLCPNLKYVVLEQLGTGLQLEAERTAFQQDFLKMDNIVSRYNAQNKKPLINDFLPKNTFQLTEPIESTDLYEQQLELSNILESTPDFATAKARLNTSSLANSAWKVEEWQPYMLETALKIAQKWKRKE